ncbi:hypothetical protein niasHS_002578 [Heterodera schachtii]|uniref:tRNA (guanine(37)-N1)-methyltransferase n=1 Tax=Heterodera schachtii TaxID=97005 RepID=A0ABD2KKU2_HETSC
MFPPISAHGMLTLDRSKFTKSIQIPFVSVPVKCIDRVRLLSAVRAVCLERMPRLKPWHTPQNCDGSVERLLLFDPDKFGEEATNDLAQQLSQTMDSSPEFGKMAYTMEYEDWDLRRCIQSVLPEGFEFSGFEQCGHIIHLNLREHLLPFRFTIGHILLDKIPSARTVLNKVDTLTHEFRVMDAELVAGEAEFMTEVVEHGLRYRLDYSKVFWNSRLSRVHSETFAKFDQNSVVFDAFAGVGPFILPAVKKRKVKKAFANDLNPASIEFMRESIRLNGIKEERIETYVMDGGEFIRKVIPEKVVEFCQNLRKESDEIEGPSQRVLPLNFHVVMNLPGLSAQFLPHFRSFMSDFGSVRDVFEQCHFWIHCHFFIKGTADYEMEWYKKEAERIVAENMAIEVENLAQCLKEVQLMRWVSTWKAMFCARILLPSDYAFSADREETKRMKRAIGNCEGEEEEKEGRVAKELRRNS